MADSAPTRSRWTAFGVAGAVAALTLLDISKVNVGLPSIEKALGAGPTQLELITAGYTLAFGLVLVPSGRLGDVRSRRAMFLIGLAGFAVMSLGCALAPSITTLIVFRVLQGVAAGIQMPQVLGLVQQLFQGEERGRAFGLFGAITGLSTALGPTLGGLLILLGGETDGWRLLFWMNVPLAAILWVVAYRLLPRTQTRAGDAHLDPVGVGLLALAILSLLLPFVLTTGQHDPPERWFILLGFVGFIAAFVAWERHYAAGGRTPIIDFSLFRDAGYRNGILISLSYFAAVPATFLCQTLFLQEGLELTPVLAGLVTVPFALSSAVSSFFAGRLVNRLGRPLVIGGIAIVIVAFGVNVVMAELLPRDLAAYGMGAAMFLAGIGGGAVISPNQTLTLANVNPEEGGLAGSIGQLGQRIGTAIGLSAATAAFYAALATGGSGLAGYHVAFRSSATVSGAFILLAVVFGLADQIGRRHRARRRHLAEASV